MVVTDLRDTSSWIAGHDPLSVVALTDVVIDRLGHDVGSGYVETYWLPILGPSAIWAARRLVDRLDTQSVGVEIPLESLSRSLGLGGGVARNSPVVRTLTRLVDFGMAATGGGVYALRRRFPPLTARQVKRLPEYLADSHRLEIEAAR
jgi:hypothetical protein